MEDVTDSSSPTSTAAVPPATASTTATASPTATASSTATIANLLDETRSFAPPAHIAAGANVDASWAGRAAADPVGFWEEQARRLDWHTPWHTAHTWEPVTRAEDGSLTVPRTEWFAGGRLNVAVNCVDRHVAAGRGDKVALHFEGEPGDRRSVTYAEL